MGSKNVALKPAKILRSQDILSISQFSRAGINTVFKTTSRLKNLAINSKPSNILAGKIVVLLFYEPSSRTLSSFDAAIKQLGGQTIVINNPLQLSSIAKGETFEDTIRTLEAYCDAIVLRHPEAGFADKAAQISQTVPIINAGDGAGEHPTQALLDLYTIWNFKKRLTNLKGLIIGDILNARALHSLISGVSLYEGNSLYLLSPRKLRLQKESVKKLRSKGLKIIEIETVSEIPTDCDFWYVTRVQKERFKTLAEYKKVENKIIVTKELVTKYGNKQMIIMHCLPRVGEIDTELDSDSSAVYLKEQIRNGMYVRMALLKIVLN